MTSGFTLIFFFTTSAAASKIARACISVISGYAMPRRQPRWPSIGLNSCSSWTRCCDRFDGLTPIFCASIVLRAVIVRQELVQRRIEQADRCGQAFERA